MFSLDVNLLQTSDLRMTAPRSPISENWRESKPIVNELWGNHPKVDSDTIQPPAHTVHSNQIYSSKNEQDFSSSNQCLLIMSPGSEWAIIWLQLITTSGLPRLISGKKNKKDREREKERKKKNPPANAGNTGDADSIPGSGRFPGGRHSNLFQYSCPGNSMDRGAWQATVHGAAKSQTWLSDWAWCV